MHVWIIACIMCHLMNDEAIAAGEISAASILNNILHE